MGNDFVRRIVERFGEEYEEVIVGIASRIRAVPSLIMGNLSIPEYSQGTPGEVDLLVPTDEHRHKLLWELQGIFRHLDDGSVLFCDGGVELELRLRVYTCEDLGVELDWFRGWWAASETVHQSSDWLRLPQVDVSITLLLLREEEDDLAVARLLLNSRALDSEGELPPRIVALVAQLYADDLNRIADALEKLGEDLE